MSLSTEAARLVDGNRNSGRLEVYHDGEWGSVCSDKFGYHEAKVACRMIGYSKAIRAFTTQQVYGNKIVLSRQLKCDGTESMLSACDYDNTMSCSGSVYLECSNGQPHIMI